MYVSADPLLTSATLFQPYDPRAPSLLEPQIPPIAPFYARARVALWALLQTMHLGPEAEVLLPAFMCDSVLGPIEAVGATPKFYPVGPALEITAAHVLDALTPASRALIVPHYFGLPTPLQELATLCRDREIWLIEDCAHALYSVDGETPLGRRGDAAIFSPWKTLPIPDGGALVLNNPELIRPDPLPEPNPLRLAARMAYRILPTIESAMGWSPRLALLERQQLRSSMQNQDRSPSFQREAGSDFSRQMMERSNGYEIRARRRSNYEQFAKVVASQPYLRTLRSDLSEGVCPLGLPIMCDDREHARRHFLSRGINVRAYWEQLPREVDATSFPIAHDISRKILILPVHQSLTQRQIDHITRSIETLTGGVPE